MPTGIPNDKSMKSAVCKHCTASFDYVGRSRRFCSKDCSHASWVAAHPDRRADHVKKYELANGEKIAKWREVNRDKMKANARRHYEKNRDVVIARARHADVANPDAAKARKRKYAATELGKGTALAGVHRRLARLKGNGGSHTHAQWVALREWYGNSCLGCQQFFAPNELTRDHVAPLSRGGTNDIGNIQPLCMPCNKAKGAALIDYRPDEFRLAA